MRSVRNARNLVNMLDMFLGYVTDAVSAGQGIINDLQGEALMASWCRRLFSTE